MDQFRKTLKRRIVLLSVLSIVTALFATYHVFFTTETIQNMIVFEFQMGALSAICIISSLNIIRYKNILIDDNKLKLECNKEKDERFKAIKSKAGIPIVPIFSVILIITGILAGYYNITVFYTLIVVAMFQIMISGVIKLIYMKRM